MAAAAVARPDTPDVLVVQFTCGSDSDSDLDADAGPPPRSAREEARSREETAVFAGGSEVMFQAWGGGLLPEPPKVELEVIVPAPRPSKPPKVEPEVIVPAPLPAPVLLPPDGVWEPPVSSYLPVPRSNRRLPPPPPNHRDGAKFVARWYDAVAGVWRTSTFVNAKNLPGRVVQEHTARQAAERAERTKTTEGWTRQLERGVFIYSFAPKRPRRQARGKPRGFYREESPSPPPAPPALPTVPTWRQLVRMTAEGKRPTPVAAEGGAARAAPAARRAKKQTAPTARRAPPPEDTLAAAAAAIRNDFVQIAAYARVFGGTESAQRDLRLASVRRNLTEELFALVSDCWLDAP
jgi:hypothetical protein